MAQDRTTIPSESELSSSLKSLRSAHPTLGIPKIHTLLLEENPSWSVSEKRTRKILQSLGLVLSSNGANGTKNSSGKRKYPISRLNPQLPVASWTNRVSVKYFDDVKGKGLVAKENISAGDVIWKEDPFSMAAEWDIHDLQSRSVACWHCSTPIPPTSSSAQQCSTIDTPSLRSPTAKSSCTARFCNRLCLSRSTSTLSGHLILCPSANPASAELITFARRHEWMAFHALARCTARLLWRRRAAMKQGGVGSKERIKAEEEYKADWEMFLGLAVLSMEDRFKYASLGEDGNTPSSGLDLEPDRDTWKEAYRLYLLTFEKEKDKVDSKSDPAFEDELFTYDGFLRGLGRMNLNVESHGGIYALHSHLNHSCIPNVSVRHFDTKTALSRITVLATRDIQADEELVITYVNPALNLKERRARLGEWGFGRCTCKRCLKEEKEQADSRTKTKNASSGAVDDASAVRDETMEDLERELKAGLGVL